jgi:para-aminobenzoate synthetase component 1
MVSSDHSLRFWAGGGLVADSRADDEYQECLDKASAMLKLMRECGGHLEDGQCSGL